ncbi:Arylsulfatase A [Tenacibaculum sp. MAR_2009_124]|uniref:sulfatase n=1 Tax=Tenacibaculum sp. MAR_2009_124 TaxID=1250059 RepID=UPI00089A24E6|nr:sulfatase [Tenacibaculum sp. MAR_2009_124]SEB80625.1 Arylsulfatase A [Tenacibaculum sp. MAR_2009_124]
MIVLFSCSFISPIKEKKNNKIPNIIIFLVDDMGLMDTSVSFLTDEKNCPKEFYLNKLYSTPNMEKLAKQGVRFSNFYAHSVCSPSRSTILTGQNSARHGVTNWIRPEFNNKGDFGPTNWNWEGLTKDKITLPKILKEAGYKTIHIGKAHFGPIGSEGSNPMNLGFEVNIAGSSIGQPGSYLGTDNFGNSKGKKKRAVKGLEIYHGKEVFLTEALTLEAKEVITQSKEEGKPFFLYMSHYAVHSPFQSDIRFKENYENKNISEKAKAFATLIEGIDKSLGDIVRHVRNLDLGENTILLFVGDNGSDAPLKIENNYSSSFPLKGKKGTHWEGGMRVPFIASWITPTEKNLLQRKLPIKSGYIQEQMGSIMDFLPTLCDITSTTIPENYIMDGFNLKKQFLGKKNRKRKESFLNHYPHKHRSSYFTSLVEMNWKVVYHYQVENTPKYELYNLKTDPFESTNLASNKPIRLKKMMKALQFELQSKNALYPIRNNKVLEVVIP